LANWPVEFGEICHYYRFNSETVRTKLAGEVRMMLWGLGPIG